MKLLFSSDIHGMYTAFECFSEILRTGDYDAGVLGGDLLDEWLPDQEVIRLLGIGQEDLIDELPGEGKDTLWPPGTPHVSSKALAPSCWPRTRPCRAARALCKRLLAGETKIFQDRCCLAPRTDD